MIPIDLATTHRCSVEQCLPVSAAHYKGFTAKALQMKALHRPDPVPTVVPQDDPPSGGASGGGAILGGEGAPGSGTGIPGHIINTGRF